MGVGRPRKSEQQKIFDEIIKKNMHLKALEKMEELLECGEVKIEFQAASWILKKVITDAKAEEEVKEIVTEAIENASEKWRY